jgi:ubiquinone/menaquinone biosynthesis C-methylase UbiE
LSARPRIGNVGAAMSGKQGLDLDRVVLLGRTLDEYQRAFGLDLESFRGKTILDVAAGVSSFTAESRERGLNVTAFDRIYSALPAEIKSHCERDLEEVARDIGRKSVYKWGFYKSAEGMRVYRARAYQTFLKDFTAHPDRYVSGNLPGTPFADRQFDLALASYLLFVYEDQLSYEFHKETMRELMRITSEEIRVYPIVTFEARPSKYLERIRNDSEFKSWDFEVISTDFEFLRDSNCFLKVSRK